MRTPTSTLSLLLFIQLASSLPTTDNNFYPQDCHHESCSIKKHTPPPSKPLPASDPHFPSHQLSPSLRIQPETDDVEIDNTPLTPTTSTSSSDALSASHPLSSSYLMSISNTNPASSPSIQKAPIPSKSEASPLPLAAKPSSALPALRKEDAEKYWATISTPNPEDSDAAAEISETGCSGSAYYRIQTLRISRASAKDYSDLIVVGIVVLFLAVVVVLEGLERVREKRSLHPRRNSRLSGKRGQIFLEDDETLAYVIKKPSTVSFLLETAPPSYHMDEEMDPNEKGGYESDAEESV